MGWKKGLRKIVKVAVPAAMIVGGGVLAAKAGMFTSVANKVGLGKVGKFSELLNKGIAKAGGGTGGFSGLMSQAKGIIGSKFKGMKFSDLLNKGAKAPSAPAVADQPATAPPVQAVQDFSSFAAGVPAAPGDFMGKLKKWFFPVPLTRRG